MLNNEIDKLLEKFGLNRNFTSEELKQAYKDLVQIWHPDRISNNPRLQKKTTIEIQKINNAYEILKQYLSYNEPISIKENKGIKYCLVLINIDDDSSKLHIVQILKELTGLSLDESTNIIETAPNVVLKGISFSEAKKLEKHFESLGAKVEIQKDEFYGTKFW